MLSQPVRLCQGEYLFHHAWQKASNITASFLQDNSQVVPKWHKATHFLISSTTFIPSSSTSVNIATLQVLPKKQNKIQFCSNC